MTDQKSTLEFVICKLKLKRGPENLVRGQEEKNVRQLLTECENFHLGLDHLGSLLHHYNQPLYSNFYTLMKESAV